MDFIESFFMYPVAYLTENQYPYIAYSGGYPFSISGDIRSVPS